MSNPAANHPSSYAPEAGLGSSHLRRRCHQWLEEARSSTASPSIQRLIDDIHTDLYALGPIEADMRSVVHGAIASVAAAIDTDSLGLGEDSVVVDPASAKSGEAARLAEIGNSGGPLKAGDERHETLVVELSSPIGGNNGQAQPVTPGQVDEFVGTGVGMPAATEKGHVVFDVRAVTGSHQLLGRCRLPLPPVHEAAAGVVTSDAATVAGWPNL